MKKIFMLTVSFVAIVGLSGCGGGSAYDERYDDGFYDGARHPEASMTTLYLRDVNGFSAGGVHYVCEDPSGVISTSYLTAPNGEFTFYPGERCTFDLLGFHGTPGDPLFIQDDTGMGKGDIPYSCYGGDAGMTYPDGSFEYFQDDSCTFYL